MYSSSFQLIKYFTTKKNNIINWFKEIECNHLLPLYSSVDIRDAGFKIASVDTNIFPAGFNNLCAHGLEDAIIFMHNAIIKRVPDCKNVLIFTEEHTRNTWYLENIRILKKIIERAGFNATISTFIEDKFDLIILNNDLITGIPDVLKDSDIPIYPAMQAGWHSRLKSSHFKYTQELINSFAKTIELDPWIFSCLYSVENNIDIFNPKDRQKIMDASSDLIKKIQAKYQEHDITEKPYLFIKVNSGTYGMGVIPIEDPTNILHLNRKQKNKLNKGKSSKPTTSFLIQEGVPTIHQTDEGISEVCIYQIENNLIGGFYRTHSKKTPRENLNSRGMQFQTMCPHLDKYSDCGIRHDMNRFDIYRILSRISALAASQEIHTLQKKVLV